MFISKVMPQYQGFYYFNQVTVICTEYLALELSPSPSVNSEFTQKCVKSANTCKSDSFVIH